MPIITTPTSHSEMPPSVYRICGLSMHNVAEPLRQVMRQETDEDGNRVDVVDTVVAGYMVIEWESGDGSNGAFVRRAGGTVRVDGQSFAAYLADPVGGAIAALLKLYLHEAMVEVGMFPAGINAVSDVEYQTIASFCGRYLASL
jgi:hypothetical protein